MEGLFVTVEGIDGCGKSTFVKGLAKALKSEGVGVAVTAEPTATWLGEAVRRSWNEGVSPYAEACLFMADRVEHCKEIAGLLEKESVVLCDRYNDSTLAYQGAALGRECEDGVGGAIDWLRRATPPDVLVPDLTFLLKLEPRLAMDRISGRNGLTKFEKLAFLREVDGAYGILARERRFVILDARKKPGALAAEASRRVRDALARRK